MTEVARPDFGAARRDAWSRGSGMPVALLVVLFLLSLALLHAARTPSGLPAVWPAPGLLLGATLLAASQCRGWVLAVGTGALVVAHVVTGFPAASAVGFSLATGVAVLVAHHRLRKGLADRRIGLLEEGDVSRLISASAQGATAAAVLSGVTVLLAGSPEGSAAGSAPGTALLAALAAWSTHAAAFLVLVPLFVAAPGFPAAAPLRERVVQSALVVGVTAAMFAFADAPPLVFAVMPMFAWLAYRGTLREASRLLAVVGVLACGATVVGLGPVHELQARYSLSPELTVGFLQLFLIDCALILLPLSVMTTQQRMSAASAAAGERTLQRLVDAATGSAVIATDLEGTVQLFNPGAVGMFLRSAEDTIGQRADLLFSDVELHRQAARLGTVPTFAAICAAAVASDEDRASWTFHRPDGEQRTLLLTVTPVAGDGERATRYLCVGDDVTEREAAHRAALVALEHERKAVERLTELEQIKGDFVATVSHELRTPLTSMIGYLELLREGQVGDLSEAQDSLTERVERNGRRLLLLVEDLLLLSQVEDREMRLTPVRTDLRAAAEAAYDALEPVRASRDLVFLVELPPEPVVHVGDPVQVERMLLNLLSNAVKFTPDHGTVELRVEDGDGFVQVVVRDTGMGIPEAEQDQLFTRFYRSTAATAQAIQGTGLGLTIVKAIVQRHGGDIDVASSEETGTRVTVRLPKLLAPDAHAPRAESAGPTLSGRMS
jgi:signal transduction histidine kinase